MMQIFERAACVVLLCMATALQAQDQTGQTLTLDFAPPDMVVQPICLARASDSDLTKFWGAWDGITLPDRDPSLITRDLRRLTEIDALEWDPTIQKAILALGKSAYKFTSNDVLLAQITQMIALGEFNALADSGLVAKLLAQSEGASSRIQFVLSGLLNEGIGIARDQDRGAELLVSAGYGGNADALLALTRRSMAGTAPKDWDITPALAVNMAFGALVGQMDPLICDRIARIAREYTAGTVVTRDDVMAVRWYRFAADLGDPISAWRVVEYHLQSELVTKDNAVLMTYLEKAAQGGLPYAMVTLGRILEAGALAPQDIAGAENLYKRAAAMGDRDALLRLSGFLETRLHAEPDLRPAFRDTLQRLSYLPSAPGWAFGKQANLILQDQGRWAGQAASRPLLLEAAKRQDPNAIRALAQTNLGLAQTEAQFYAALDPLIQMLANFGEVGAVAEVQQAFMCKAPDSPKRQEVAYWHNIEAAIGSSSLDITPQQLAALSADADPLAMATLQAQALSGRAASLANLQALLRDKKAPASATQLWSDYAANFSGVSTSFANLELVRAATPVQRDAALDLFRGAVDLGETGAALKLTSALLQNPDFAHRREALALLEPLAAQGSGEAMDLLQIADPIAYPTPAAVYAKYAKTIDARGDFGALLLAMPYLGDTAQREIYRARATEAMSCTFPEAIAFANVWGQLGDPSQTRRWMSIAAELSGQDAWQMIVLGDTQRAHLGAEGLVSATALYEQSSLMGSKTAVQRLLKLYGVRGDPNYNEARAADLYVTLIARSDPAGIPDLLAELTRRNPALSVVLDMRLDLDAVYQKAAEAGSPAAMREHARRLSDAAKLPTEVAAASDWLIRAAQAGDAKAMLQLSQAYSLGVGVAPSIDLAQSWLQRAAEAGEPSAIDLIKVLQAQTVAN